LKPLCRSEGASLLEWEQAFRRAVLVVGCQVFGPLLQQRIDQIDAQFQPKPGQQFMGRRAVEVWTLFGRIRIQRDYYHGVEGGHCPADCGLSLEGHATPALARLMSRAAAQQAFGAASRDLAEYGAIEVDERQIQRVVLQIAPEVDCWLKQLPVLYVSCDGTGTPMRKEELRGRRGKQPDGGAKTREVKLGAVFTQHGVDNEGHPIRDHESTSYIASYASSEQFALLLRAEARRRGVAVARQVVFLSDGAAWAEDMAPDCFAGCASILDFYHASERLHEMAVALDPCRAKVRVGLWKRWLLQDKVARVIKHGRELQAQGAAEPKIVEEQLNFLERHQHRMAYGTYREQGWFIGSGVVEAGCRTVVGKRLKQSGMFWSELGATCVLNFRTLLLSQRFDAFWRDRVNARTAENDALPLAA
jgi:hypothetical protein